MGGEEGEIDELEMEEEEVVIREAEDEEADGGEQGGEEEEVEEEDRGEDRERERVKERVTRELVLIGLDIEGGKVLVLRRGIIEEKRSTWRDKRAEKRA